jgi:WD40 repeat protein
MSFSRDGKLLATGAFGNIHIWRVEEPESKALQVPVESLGNMGYTSALFSSNGKFVVTTSALKIRIWQLDRLQTQEQFDTTPDYMLTEFFTGSIIAAALMSDDESILTASNFGQVLQWRPDHRSSTWMDL